MKKALKRSMALALAAGSLTLFTSGAATAAGFTTFPGTMCAADKSNISKITFSSKGYIQNDSTSSSATVYCATPLRSDEEAHGVAIVIEDTNSNSNGTCTATASWNDVIYHSSNKTTSNAGLNRLEWYSLPSAMFSLKCSLPAKVTTPSRVWAFDISY